MTIAGLVLAAGAGARAGGPKALRHTDDGTAWLDIAASSLRDAGCAPVVVVLGAQVESAMALVPAWAQAVVAADWAEGQSASLRAGLAHIADATLALATLVTLVDLPEQGSQSARRVIDSVGEHCNGLARAVFSGEPGHPVLIGRNHWDALMVSLYGDTGARDFLAEHHVVEVDCTGLGGGRDIDAASRR